ncbi:MAG: NUDIX hydrolase [Rhodoluna sp.]|nr:NUDIX hydrolase [Rhodoluna sp.]
MPKDRPVELPATETELVFKGRVWDVVTEHFEFEGHTLARDFIRHPGAVAVIALNERQEVLLINQYRRPVGAFLWELPAGLLDVQGESLEAAALRELAEETDYQAERIEHLITFHASPGGNSESIAIYLASGLSVVETDFVRTGEEANLQPTWVPLVEAVESVMRSDMKNPAAVIGILALARKMGV